MAIDFQIIPVSFGGGVDTKTDPKQVIPGKLLALGNGKFPSFKEIRKRNGFAPLSKNIDGSTSTISQGQALSSYQNELVLFSGTECYSYDGSTAQMTDKGACASVNISTQNIVRNSYGQTTPDLAYHPAGLILTAWEDSRGGARYSITDSKTNQLVIADKLISSTASNPVPVALGNYFILFYFESSDNHLRYIAIPALSPNSPQTPVDFATNINSTHPNFSVLVFFNRAYVAYNNSDAGGGISLRYLDLYLTASSTSDTTGEAASVCLSVISDSGLNQVWVTYYDGTSVKAFCSDTSLNSKLTPTVIETLSSVRNVTGFASSGTLTAYYEVSASDSYNHLIRENTLTNSGTAGTPKVFLRSVGLSTRAFSYNGTVYLTLSYDSPLQPTYFIVDQSAQIIAKIAPSLGGGLTAKSTLPKVESISESAFIFSALQKDLLTTTAGNVYTQTGVISATLDFQSQDRFYKAEIANTLHLSGGFLQMYDGQSVVEHGFHLFPEGVSVTSSTTGGNLGNGSVATQYQVSVTYEWMDNQGQIHRSSASVPSTVNFTSGVTTGSIAVTIPTLRLTAKTGSRTPVSCVVYCTAGNGTIFYQDSSVTSPVLNDPTVDTVSYTVTASDTVRTGNPILYTTGGVLDNIAPPASRFIAKYLDRVILLPSESPTEYWYSKEVVVGSPVEFSDSLVGAINTSQGLIGTCAMDDKLIFFTNDYCYYLSGEGPDATGAQNDFSFPLLITGALTGCSNAKSIVLMKDGIMRQTSKGIYLLDRSLNDSYIGADVEAYNNATVTSAIVVADKTEVRFTLDTGIILIYDYTVGQWSTDQNLNVVDSALFNRTYSIIDSATNQSKTLTQKVHTILFDSGLALQEDPSLYTDNNNFVPLSFTTSWLSLSGLQGYQRVRRFLILGDYKSAHKLRVQIAYDFNPVPVQEVYIDPTAVLNTETYGSDADYGASSEDGGPDPTYEFEIQLEKQKCTAIQITISDTQNSNFGEGYSISGLSFDVGLKRGPQKLPASRRFG